MPEYNSRYMHTAHQTVWIFWFLVRFNRIPLNIMPHSTGCWVNILYAYGSAKNVLRATNTQGGERHGVRQQ